MHEALYGPQGFYTSGRGAGRRRDFITSPELGPLFGAVMANALDAWWAELGRPDPFVVVEAGAGRGALRQAVLAVASSPIAYRSVEFDDDWPEAGEVGVVIGNELLDNLPFKVLERAGGAWRELLVHDQDFVLGQVVDGFAHVAAPEGARIPWHTAAVEWLDRAKATFARGRIALVDYGTPHTVDLVGRQWLRTYREHDRGFEPLRDPGMRDITTDVAFDQLRPDRLTPQAAWLRAHGIEALAEEARATWRARAAIGDLAAVKARSRVDEAAALVDPDGLGGFLVAEWDLPPSRPSSQPARGTGLAEPA